MRGTHVILILLSSSQLSSQLRRKENQSHLKTANATVLDEGSLQSAIVHGKTTARERLDQAMQDATLDLIIGPGDSGLFSFAALAGTSILIHHFCDD